MAKHKGKSTGSAVSRQQQKDAQKAKRTAEREKQQAAAMAQAAKPIETPKLPWPDPSQPTEMREQYRFLNPYNFVRYLPEPVIPPDDPDAQLLGRCTPPPHDHYVGLTGRITCTLETVTPLFISDSHDVKVTKTRLTDGREVEHKSYRFFQYEGKDAIPATSLRGMVQSMFEAATNSPLSIFDGDERLEYRIDPAEARRFRPGIVRSLPKDGQPGVIALCEEAKVSAYYDDPEGNVLDDSWTCGEKTWAIVGTTKNNIPMVEIISRNHKALAADGRPVREGWVKMTGQTIDTKRNESFFYFKGDPAKAQTVSFDAERERDFNNVLHAQTHYRKKDFHSHVQDERLSPGNLMYVELEPEDNKQVRNIALARVARLRYRKAIGDLLPDHLKPSECYDQLDIASRVFGWVKATREDDRSARVAYAGRVRFGHATLTEDGDKGVYDSALPLATLGTPKPTTTLFYLRKKEGKWNEEERKKPGAATTIGYDGPNELRGRKVYRHHGAALNRLEYERAGRRSDHQNRSVRGVRAPGNVFEFSIDFHNLAPVELGALLWTLNLSDGGCYYRLGYCKPLGFGSVRLIIGRIDILDFNQRYQTLDAPNLKTMTMLEGGQWLARFETAMKRCYGQAVHELANIRDLFALLSDPKNTKLLPIHYSRIEPNPDSEGKNFEWFVANKVKSTKSDKAGSNLPLEESTDDTGLPLLTKAKKQ